MRSLPLLSLGLCLLACASDPGGLDPDDAGTAPGLDAALGDPDAAIDAGLSDLGAAADLGLPDATLEPDAAPGPDAAPADFGVAGDAEPLDLGGLGDAQVEVDAGGAPDAASSCSLCVAFGTPSNEGAVVDSTLIEISGLAASSDHPGVLYAHNDSGGLPIIYALGTHGEDLGRLELSGAANVDWEDLALGPCPSGQCLYVGEIGDNGLNRPEPYAIYRIAEPTLSSTVTVSVPFEYFELEYPQGAHFNAETLLVHPQTGDVYIVTKTEFGAISSVYQATAPLVAGAINPLLWVADLPIPTGLDLPVTGGDIHPCGGAVLLRGYNALFYFEQPVGAAFEATFSAPYSRLPAPTLGLGPSNEPQGEAVTWAPDGRGYYTVSERANQQLHFTGCQ